MRFHKRPASSHSRQSSKTSTRRKDLAHKLEKLEQRQMLAGDSKRFTSAFSAAPAPG